MFDLDWTDIITNTIYMTLVIVTYLGLYVAWATYKDNKENKRLKILWEELLFKGAIKGERMEVFTNYWVTEIYSPYRGEDYPMLELRESKKDNGKTVITVTMFSNEQHTKLTIEEFIRQTDKDIPFPTSN